MPGFGLGGGGEDWFRQFRGFLKTGGQFDAAHRLPFAVFLPAGAGEIAAHHAFNRERFRFLHDHTAPPELRREGLQCRRQRIIGLREQVIGFETRRFELNQKIRNLGEDLALARNALGMMQSKAEIRSVATNSNRSPRSNTSRTFAAFELADAGQIKL